MASALKASVLIGAVVCSGPGYGQALSYHHRSTPEGDRLSGAADLEAANGRATLQRAQAYDQHVEAAEKLMYLQYQYYQLRQQVAHDQIKWRERRAEYNRRWREEKDSKGHADALTLLNRVQLGLYVWPEALSRPKYASSVSTIESILKNWRKPTYGVDAFDARALATEAAVLERRVAADAVLSHPSRWRAVCALRLVQRIPLMDVTGDSAANSLASNP